MLPPFVQHVTSYMGIILENVSSLKKQEISGTDFVQKVRTLVANNLKALKATATKQDIADLKEIMASRGKISPDIYNKSVCIKQIGIQCNREMKLEEIVTFLYLRCYSDNRIRSSEITRSFCNVFLSNKFWPKGEDRDIRDNFLRRFGTDTAEKLCAYLLDISGVKWFSSFTEDDFGMIMSDFRTTVIFILCGL